MSGTPKVRMDNRSNKKKIYCKKNYGSGNKQKFLAAGQSGFLATCNFREKECVRELYRLLNRYADTVYGPQQDETQDKKDDSSITEVQIIEPKEDASPATTIEDSTEKKDFSDDSDDEEEDEDISTQLQKDINSTKDVKGQGNKYLRFQTVSTGATNCCFITTTLNDPVDLGIKIIQDLYDTKQSLTKNVLRFIPIEAVCKANIKDIIDTAGLMFDKYFLHGERTFSIVYNKRYNNDIKRDDIIKELADLISAKNIKNKVDLKDPEFSVIVEIIKGLCCLSVLPHYIKYRKYNLSELCTNTNI